MKQRVGMMAVAICAMLVLNGPAWSDQKGKGEKDESKETVEMAAKAKVTIDQAIKTASEKVPVRSSRLNWRRSTAHSCGKSKS